MKKRNKAMKMVQKENVILDKFSLDDEDLQPIVTEEESAIIKKFFADNPALKTEKPEVDEAWIQTFSGRRFHPMSPNPDSIVIQDIAHSLSMLCRFTGHCSKFYSVAQHSVLVSHICDFKDAFWGLMHDASEAYLTDIPSPLKRSGKFEEYINFEKVMMKAICKRFNMAEEEPESVKRADGILLCTEARDLMSPLHTDWVQKFEPLPFTIDPLPPEEAEDLFLKRFYELLNSK